jgi:hypothetical protein
VIKKQIMKRVDGCFEKGCGNNEKKKKKEKQIFFKNKLKSVYKIEIFLVGSTKSILQI